MRGSLFLTIPVLAAALVLACGEIVDAPMDPLQADISDAIHGDGNRHFYFLPPLVPAPSPGGIFDGTYDPKVQICAWNESECTDPLVAEFTTTTGPGSETIRVDDDAEHYIVNWHSGDYDLDPATTYRINVLVGTLLVGYADVDVVSSGRELRNVNTGEYVGLLNGRTLPIRFRLESGVMCGALEECIEEVVGPAGATIDAPDGHAVIDIPAGALDGTIRIAVGLRDPDACFPRSVMLAGECYEIITDQGPGFTLHAPASIAVCTDHGEPDAGRLARLDPDDPSQTMTFLEVGAPDLLDCEAVLPESQLITGVTTSFSYIAPTIDGEWTEIGGSPRLAARATPLSFYHFDPRWYQPRQATSVLVTGGIAVGEGGFGVALNAADVFTVPPPDGTPTSAPVGNMIAPRAGGTATRLSNGMVLIAGGVSTDLAVPVADAELYDPATGTFIETGSMTVPRTRHTATLLTSGRVLITGGVSVGLVPPALASAEIYDPSTGTFSPAIGSMTTGRERHTATLLPTGQVLIIGGDLGGDFDNPHAPPVVLRSTEMYIPSTGTFSPRGNLSVPRRNHTATYLPDYGYVMVAGGTDGSLVHASVEIVRPDGVLLRILPLAVGVMDHTANLTWGRNLLLVGGTTDVDGSQHSGATQWVRKDGRAFIAPSMFGPRSGHSSAHIRDNRFLIVGGLAIDGLTTTDEIFRFR